MAYFGFRTIYVNRSNTKIPVYNELVHSSAHIGSTTAGGEVLGHIHPNEFFSLIPNEVMSLTHYRIVFRDGNGIVRHGYIETSPAMTFDDYAWASYLEPYNYYNSNGSTLVGAARETIGGTSYYIFTVVGSARTYRDSTGKSLGTLPVGTKLATTSSTAGAIYTTHMVFHKKKLPNGSWQNLVSNETYGFVDLGFTVGTMPSDRPIR